MAAPYVDSPATERDDVTSLSAHHIDFSFAQPFGSPSKNPADNIRNQMKGLRGRPQPMQTPRVRNALIDRRNPSGIEKQEFTPLLKSAQRNQMLQRSFLEDKENGGVPDTPAAFRSSYASQTPALPVSSSMLDEEHTGSSADAGRNGTPLAPAASSSMVDSTPMPQLPRRGEGGILDQGNVLTLRDQEAKLDQIQKDNFGLKLKIHFLEEALKKTGNEFHQATVKENVELKTEKLSLEYDLKKQRKRLQDAAHELEEYRQRYEEYQKWVQKRHSSERDQEELDQLQKLAEESQRIADEREQELDQIRQKLEEAENTHRTSDDAQQLKDDLQDLEAELRDRERQLDEKDEQLENLQDQLKLTKSSAEELGQLQHEIDEMDAEMKEKDEDLDSKNAKIAELEERVSSANDREKSTKKLRGDVSDLESRLREKDQALEETNDRLRALEKKLREELGELESQVHEKNELLEEKSEEIQDLQQRLRDDVAKLERELDQKDEQVSGHDARLRALENEIQNVEAEKAAELKQRDDEVQNAQRELADKDGEIRALQERLQTARGSWDTEAQYIDARIQEKDRRIQETEIQLREKLHVIQDRDNELAEMQKKLRTAGTERDEAAESQTRKFKEQSEQLCELQEKLRVASISSQSKFNEKENLLQEREKELQTLQNRLTILQSGQQTEAHQKDERIRELQLSLRQKESEVTDRSHQITSLKSRLGAMETPSKKDSLLKQQADQVHSLQRQLQKLEQDKDVELDELEQQLQTIEADKADLYDQIEVLKLQSKAADRDRSVLRYRAEDINNRDRQIERLEEELQQLRTKLQNTIEQKQADVRDLEHKLELARTKADSDDQQLQRQRVHLQAELESRHAEATQALEDEILILESNLDEAVAAKAGLEIKVQQLEDEVRTAWRAKDNGTPARERNDLRLKLRESESKCTRLQDRIETLESDLVSAQQERTLAEERMDLHDMLKQAKIEAEDLQLQLAERDVKISTATAKERGLRTHLRSAEGKLEDVQSRVSDLENHLQTSASKEKELREQLKELKDAKVQLQELEAQLDERKGSSSGHVRREVELRTQLKNAKIELESLQLDLVEKDERIQSAVEKEQQLRERLKKSRADDTYQLNQQDLQAQLDEADLELQTLQTQLHERDKRLQTSLKREQELQQKFKNVQRASDNERTLDEKCWNNELSATQRQHEGELKGLAKQIQYLRAKCTREEKFRSDLVYTKKWFLMQVEMYNRCNQADLRLLEEMGLTPDLSFRERKHSLRTVGLMTVACVRMRKMQQAWASNQKLQESLLRKLEAMRKKQGMAAGRP